MEAFAHYMCRLLGGLFQDHVEPVAAALDEDPPGPAALEEGRRSAAARAAAVRDHLAALCRDCADGPRGAPSRQDTLAAYEGAKSLLADFWRIAAADAESWAAGGFRGAAAEYARGVARRAERPAAPAERGPHVAESGRPLAL